SMKSPGYTREELFKELADMITLEPKGFEFKPFRFQQRVQKYALFVYTPNISNYFF
ncbi:hypothetical protein BSGG_5370, partial [Bacteroides sp. D2]